MSWFSKNKEKQSIYKLQLNYNTKLTTLYTKMEEVWPAIPDKILFKNRNCDCASIFCFPRKAIPMSIGASQILARRHMIASN